MNKHIKIIGIQVIFVVVALAVLYFLYPKTSMNLEENLVRFNSINAKVIMISENPDFSNPRYLDTKKGKEVLFELPPGTYYWKADNGIIEGLKNEFTIESEVGLEIKRNQSKENEGELVNIGNVKINVTKSKEGVMVGHIILEPEESEKIEDKGEYTGRQEE